MKGQCEGHSNKAEKPFSMLEKEVGDVPNAFFKCSLHKSDTVLYVISNRPNLQAFSLEFCVFIRTCFPPFCGTCKVSKSTSFEHGAKS